MCAEFEDLILDRIDGRLAPESAELLDTHIASCQSCQSFQEAQLFIDCSLQAAALQAADRESQHLPVAALSLRWQSRQLRLLSSLRTGARAFYTVQCCPRLRVLRCRDLQVHREFRAEPPLGDHRHSNKVMRVYALRT